VNNFDAEAILQEKQKNKEALKEKIRARYKKGTEGIECMEAAVDKGIFDDGKDRYVAIYARVSTQTNSLLQLYHGAIFVYKAA
jgi:hypothetical protein